MKITDDVLDVLDDIQTEALTARITRQLPRPLYVKVNKVLEACGGKWSRRDKAHVFNDDARSILDAAITLREVTTKADIGFFPTPPALARQLAAACDIRPGHTVLEPSAGAGALIDAALECRPAEVYAVERDPGMRVQLLQAFGGLGSCVRLPVALAGNVLDFVEWAPEALFDRVLMNPPFTRVGRGDHLDHVRHAFEFLKPGGVLVSVLPSSVTFRRDRRHAAFREWVDDKRMPGDVSAFEPLPVDSFKVSGTGVNTVMLRMVKS